MKVKNANLEWNVLVHDSNAKIIRKYNVFGQRFVEELHKAVKKKQVTDYKQLKEFINRYCMYHYWSKSEWEIAVGGLFATEPKDLTKIDVYFQLAMNLDRITEYVDRELKINFKEA